MDTVKDVLGKWGKKAAEATKKSGDLAGNLFQHCKLFFCLLYDHKLGISNVAFDKLTNSWDIWCPFFLY